MLAIYRLSKTRLLYSQQIIEYQEKDLSEIEMLVVCYNKKRVKELIL